MLHDERLQLLDFSRAEERRRSRMGDLDDERVDDVEVDGLDEAFRFRKPVFRRMKRWDRFRACLIDAAMAREIGHHHECTLARAHVITQRVLCPCGTIRHANFVVDGVYPTWLSLGSPSIKWTGAPGMIVEIACLYTSCECPSRRRRTQKLSNQVTMPCSFTPLIRKIVSGRLLLADVVEERVLKVLSSVCGHCDPPFFVQLGIYKRLERPKYSSAGRGMVRQTRLGHATLPVLIPNEKKERRPIQPLY